MAKIPQKQNQHLKIFFFFLGVTMLYILLSKIVEPPVQANEVGFSEFVTKLELPNTDANKVVAVTVTNRMGEDGVDIIGMNKEGAEVKTYGIYDADLRKKFEEAGIQISFKPPEEPSIWKSLLLNAFPVILLIILFFFFMRQLQAGGGKAMSFGKSRAKLQNDTKPRITFKDISGIDEVKTELEEVIDFLKDPRKFTKLGGRIPKGVLLVGSPGTGKTILARGVAGEAGVPFFSISGSDFVEMFVGVGASRVRDLFEQAKKNAPCIVFIDEIDAVGRQRGAGVGGGHDEREQTLNQLLVEMDGFESNEGVIVIAATNRSDVLDPALLRPGRFDRRVIVPKPDVKGRRGILKVHSKKTPLDNDVDLLTIAQGTPGFSGADLENLVNEAALIAARNSEEKVYMEHFELAKDKIMMGPERKSMILSEAEKRNTAYHESGHAIVGLVVEGVDPVHKVSIIPRGQALGVTIMLPDDDRLTITKDYAIGMICYAMGGRAAEELIFEKYTTGAGDDISKATDIARNMVCKWGMSEIIGPVSLAKKDDNVFLGREMSQGSHLSERISSQVDEEVHRLITTAYEKTFNILKEHRKELEMMSEALLIKETLDAEQLKRIMNGENIVSDEDREAYEKRVTANKNWRKTIAVDEVVDVTPEEKDESINPVEPTPQGI